MKNTIQKVLVVGAGTMGQQITAQIAKSDFNVVLCDLSMTQLHTAKTHIEELVPTANLCNITYCTSLEEATIGVDLVIETIHEDLKLKRELFKKLHKLTSDDTIFTSNTSDLLPSKIASSTGRKELFCAYHFHAPSYGAIIVDIMPHRNTAPETIMMLEDFTRQINLIPIILKKEHPAYIYNSILNAIMDTSVQLVIKGVADYKDVDISWMGNTGMNIGPFGMLDLIGLDTVLSITKVRARKDPLMLFGVRFFSKMVEQGKLGIKSGEGFYRYPNPEYQKNKYR